MDKSDKLRPPSKNMAFAVFVMWSIMVTTAGSLHANEIYEIQTADQAAQALE